MRRGARAAMRVAAVMVVALTAGLAAARAGAQERWRFDFENGAAISGYNDARIPGDTGTLFSLTDDLDAETLYFWRFRAEIPLTGRQSLSVLAAPLTIDAPGTFDRTIRFMDATFAPGVPVTARYVFNSYRVSWRYDLVQNERWRFGLGVTGKIRDAETRLDAPGLSASKTNVGFVPLVNFSLQRRLANGVTFELSGDALAAPQGRAEDVFAGVLLPVGPNLSLKAGYRLLEGGADNDEVYTFAAVHYLAVGAVLRF